VESKWRFAAMRRPLLGARPPRWSLHLTIPMIEVVCHSYHHHHHHHHHHHLIADSYRGPVSVQWSTQTVGHCALTVCSPGGADKPLARPTSQCILFDGENISFDASLVIYINSTNIPPIMSINRNIKIFCRCSLFHSWSDQGLIGTPVLPLGLTWKKNYVLPRLRVCFIYCSDWTSIIFLHSIN